MSVDHKRPLYAFIVVALVCSLVIADQVRSGAQWGREAPSSVVASSELVPLSDPPVPGVHHAGRPTEEPAEAVASAVAAPVPVAAAPAVQQAAQTTGDTESHPGRGGRGDAGKDQGEGRGGQPGADDLDELDDLDPGDVDDDVAPDEDDLDEVGQGQGAGHGHGHGHGHTAGHGHGNGHGKGPATALARLEHVVSALAGSVTRGVVVRALRSARHGAGHEDHGPWAELPGGAATTTGDEGGTAVDTGAGADADVDDQHVGEHEDEARPGLRRGEVVRGLARGLRQAARASR
ncbi:hypothetical protein ACFP3Q_09110 [Nocardioides sp. GCM10027113]|uniref:hypothetical protein n=1 Tax=unclassified Nocardioides TaxID=2615069 RepID=UPI0036061399